MLHDDMCHFLIHTDRTAHVPAADVWDATQLKQALNRSVLSVFSMQNRELIYPCLSKGYADAIAAHETAILQCMSDYKLDYRILEEPLLTVGLGVAFSKQDDRGLEQKLSETFEEMRADGTREEIIGRYLEEHDMGVIADVE